MLSACSLVWFTGSFVLVKNYRELCKLRRKHLLFGVPFVLVRWPAWKWHKLQFGSEGRVYFVLLRDRVTGRKSQMHVLNPKSLIYLDGRKWIKSLVSVRALLWVFHRLVFHLWMQPLCGVLHCILDASSSHSFPFSSAKPKWLPKTQKIMNANLKPPEGPRNVEMNFETRLLFVVQNEL